MSPEARYAAPCSAASRWRCCAASSLSELWWSVCARGWQSGTILAGARASASQHASVSVSLPRTQTHAPHARARRFAAMHTPAPAVRRSPLARTQGQADDARAEQRGDRGGLPRRALARQPQREAPDDEEAMRCFGARPAHKPLCCPSSSCGGSGESVRAQGSQLTGCLAGGARLGHADNWLLRRKLCRRWQRSPPMLCAGSPAYCAHEGPCWRAAAGNGPTRSTSKSQHSLLSQRHPRALPWHCLTAQITAACMANLPCAHYELVKSCATTCQSFDDYCCNNTMHCC